MPRRYWVRSILVATAILFSVGVLAPVAAVAKDGGSGHGGGNSGSGGPGGDDDGDGGGDDHGGDDGGDDHGGAGGKGGGPGRGKGRGGDGDDWDNSGSSEARGAVSQGMALPLNRVMPVVRQAAPGRVLDVDLQQWATGAWVYKFLVLSSEGEYREVFVEALSRRIVRVRER
jgi:hypothetical protein